MEIKRSISFPPEMYFNAHQEIEFGGGSIIYLLYLCSYSFIQGVLAATEIKRNQLCRSTKRNWILNITLSAHHTNHLQTRTQSTSWPQNPGEESSQLFTKPTGSGIAVSWDRLFHKTGAMTDKECFLEPR